MNIDNDVVTTSDEKFTRKILLCNSVLQSENDSLLIVPLPRAIKKNEKLVFQAQTLEFDDNNVLQSEKINSKSSGYLDSYSDSLFICQTMRYQTCDNSIYAVISIHCNCRQLVKATQSNAIFTFQYWIACKER